MVPGWTWDKATPFERGQWVRKHVGTCRHDIGKLCDLFNLTANGAERILNGDEWRPEYEQPDVNYGGSELR